MNWQGLTAFVRQFVAAVQAAAKAQVDATQGSITLALGEAVTGAALWLQAQIAKVLTLTRASTSVGADLDTWLADWFFSRLQAIAAVGQVTFARATPTLQAVVPFGSLISTGAGGLQYLVTIDATNVNYNATLSGYVLAPGTASITVPIACLTSGAVGNVLANTITSFVQPIVGVDTVTNASSLTSGADAESDPSVLTRFQSYILGLRRGTLAALQAAALAVQQGIAVVILENVDPNGTPDNGFLTVIVDDGTGTPPMSLLNAVGTAIDTTRAAGIRFGVVAPTVIAATIILTIVSSDSTKHAADQLAAQAAILAYVNSLPIGASLFWARIYQLAFDSSTNITSVTGITLNGATADLVATSTQIIKTTSVTVN